VNRLLFRSLFVLFAVAPCLVGRWYASYLAGEPDRLLRAGRQAIEVSDWDKADEYADRLIASGHRDHGRLLRGESLHKQNRPESAFNILNRIRDQGELRLQAARVSGKCLLELNNPREAERVYRFVLERQPDDVDAVRGLAVIAYDQGNWLEAESQLQKLAELAPRDGRSLWTLGIMYRDMHRFQDAEAQLRAALDRDLPGDLPRLVRAELAMALAGQKRYAEALDELGRARMDATTPSLARMKVDCLRSLGRYSEALAFAETFLAQRPADAGLLAEKGTVLVDDRRYDDALPFLERAVAGDPYDPRSRDALRRAYQALGRSADAAEQQRKMLEAEGMLKQLNELTLEAMAKPWAPRVRRKLSDVCLKLNKKELALMWAAAARAGEGGPQAP
jgi:tetratricopeptide (TPR) repeat protein